MDILAPDLTATLGSIGELKGDILSVAQRMEIDDIEAEQRPKRLWIAAQADVLSRIDDAAEKRYDQGRPRLDGTHHRRRRLVADEV